MAESVIHQIIILGCGASGLMAGIYASELCDDVLILDRNDVPGKKLPATGNGKCNFTNTFMREDCFNIRPDSVARKILNRYGCRDVLDFFERIGVPARIKRDSYCYPMSDQASSVRDALVSCAVERGCKIKLNNRIVRIEKSNGVFKLYTDSDYCYRSKKLIVSAGGAAAPAFGTDGSIYDMLRSLGCREIVKPLPALVGLVHNNNNLSELAGVRTDAFVSLFIDKNTYKTDFGEIIFSKNGISGIPVMNLSRYAVRATDEGRQVYLSLDFYPSISKDELSRQILVACRFRSRLKISEALTGFLNSKLLDNILKRLGIDNSYTDSDDFNAVKLAGAMKNFKVIVSGNGGFENAQVTTGGVALSEIAPGSMQTHFCKNLYLTGEVLDLDGICGGYNLQWAWSTGAIAGASAAGGSID